MFLTITQSQKVEKHLESLEKEINSVLENIDDSYTLIHIKDFDKELGVTITIPKDTDTDNLEFLIAEKCNLKGIKINPIDSSSSSKQNGKKKENIDEKRRKRKIVKIIG